MKKVRPCPCAIVYPLICDKKVIIHYSLGLYYVIAIDFKLDIVVLNWRKYVVDNTLAPT